MPEEFDKPLDQVIQEPHVVERDVLDFNPTTKTFSRKKIKETVYIPTTYTRGEVHKVACADKTHNYKLFDRKKYIVKCENCPKHRFIRIAFERLTPDGHIMNRDTQEILD